MRFGSVFAGSINPLANVVDKFFGQEILWFVEFWAIPPTNQVPMAEIAICSDGNVWSS
jgi:hypothetical protein